LRGLKVSKSRHTHHRRKRKVIDASLDFGAYHDGQGEVGLRAQIASYLTLSRGVRCDAKQIVITSSFGESMGLLAKLVKDKYYTLSPIPNRQLQTASRC